MKKTVTEQKKCISCSALEKPEKMIQWSIVGSRLFPDLHSELPGENLFICNSPKCFDNLFSEEISVKPALSKKEAREIIIKKTIQQLQKLLHVARKNGNMIVGQQKIHAFKNRDTAFLFILVAEDVSTGTVRALKKIAPVWRCGLTMAEMSELVSQRNVGVLGFLEASISEAVRNRMEVIYNYNFAQ